MHARFVHFVSAREPLSGEELAKLERLLAYVGPPLPLEPENAVALVVTPRLGTQSPWSSKATDIARNCGLDTIDRIERGTRWLLEGIDYE